MYALGFDAIVGRGCIYCPASLGTDVASPASWPVLMQSIRPNIPLCVSSSSPKSSVEVEIFSPRQIHAGTHDSYIYHLEVISILLIVLECLIKV